MDHNRRKLSWTYRLAHFREWHRLSSTSLASSSYVGELKNLPTPYRSLEWRLELKPQRPSGQMLSFTWKGTTIRSSRVAWQGPVWVNWISWVIALHPIEPEGEETGCCERGRKQRGKLHPRAQFRVRVRETNLGTGCSHLRLFPEGSSWICRFLFATEHMTHFLSLSLSPPSLTRTLLTQSLPRSKNWGGLVHKWLRNVFRWMHWCTHEGQLEEKHAKGK